MPRHVPAYANRAWNQLPPGQQEPIYRALPNRLFIDWTRLSTRLISMKNVTIFRTSFRYKRERDNLRTATRLAADNWSLFTNVSPSLLREGCMRRNRRPHVCTRIDFNYSLTSFYITNIMLYGLIKIDFAHGISLLPINGMNRRQYNMLPNNSY